MNFFKKIKNNYQFKLIQELINQNNYLELDEFLSKVKKNDIASFLKIFDHYKNDFLKFPKNEIFKNNILWINSFLEHDNLILSDFINFYFQKITFADYKTANYQDEIMRLNQKINLKNMNFDFLVTNSYFYQYNIITYLKKGEIQFLHNQIPFFETQNNLMFSHPNLTRAYFYVVREPLELLTLINNQFQDLDLSINYLLNLDHQNQLSNINQKDFNMHLPIKDWATNVESWTGDNVLENFNGHIFDINKVKEDPFSEFTNIIGHLIQSGLKIELDYKMITEYCDSFKKEDLNIEKTKLSNQKRKLITRQFDRTAEKFGYLI